MSVRPEAAAGPPIRVDGGLVQSRDPVHYAAGELLRAQDAYYRENNPAIWSVPGREAFNNVPAGAAILGGRYLEYDGAADVIVVHLGTKLRETVAGTTGTFADTSVTGLTSAGVRGLDSCHYNNQHILLDGVNRNRVRQSDGTYRFHGMLANTTAPTVANTGAGTGFNLSSGSVITYWLEERVKSGSTILRRNASLSTATTVQLIGPQTGVKPVITAPNGRVPVNADATHVALFATASIGGVFPVGAEIAEVALSGGLWPTIEDTRTGTDPGLSTGPTYETVAVVLPGASVVALFAKNGPPPLASSADVQEDSVVMNDMVDRTKVWFCHPDNIDAVPPVNFIRFETKEADEVQWVRFLGQATVVALRNSLWKINILPNVSDSTFQTNRVKSQLEGAHGGVSAMTVVTFSFGEKNLIAYVSRSGIFVTDGEVWHLLTDDVDWKRTVDVSRLNEAILSLNPADFRLEFTFTPIGGTLNSRTLLLHIHPSHVKPSPLGMPRAKVTLATRGARAKFVANVDSTDVVFSGQTNGRLYREWTGDVDPIGDIEFDVLVGEKFPFGVGQQGRTTRTWVHHQAGAAGQRVFARVVARTEGVDDVTEERSIPISRREHTQFIADLIGEAFQYGVRATNPPAPVGIDFFVPEMSPYGRTTVAGEP